MSRIRTIKPEFVQSESIGRLSRDARLLFIQLWTLVDDAGRARAASRMLASLLYPYDDDAPGLIDLWLGELEQEGIIRVYDVDCSRYLEITKWLKHQKIDHPSKSRLPEPREPSRALAMDLGPSTLDLGPKKKDTALRAVRAKRGEPFPEGDWLTDADRAHATSRGLTNVKFEFEKFRDHALAKGRIAKDWHAAWRNWVTSPYQQSTPRKSNGTDDAKQKWRDAADKLRKHAESGAISEPLDRLLPGPGSGES